MKSNSALLFFSIGMKGNFPTGHPVNQGFESTFKKLLYSGTNVNVILAKSSGVYSLTFLAVRLAPLMHKSLQILRF